MGDKTNALIIIIIVIVAFFLFFLGGYGDGNLAPEPSPTPTSPIMSQYFEISPSKYLTRGDWSGAFKLQIHNGWNQNISNLKIKLNDYDDVFSSFYVDVANAGRDCDSRWTDLDLALYKYPDSYYSKSYILNADETRYIACNVLVKADAPIGVHRCAFELRFVSTVDGSVSYPALVIPWEVIIIG